MVDTPAELVVDTPAELVVGTLAELVVGTLAELVVGTLAELVDTLAVGQRPAVAQGQFYRALAVLIETLSLFMREDHCQQRLATNTLTNRTIKQPLQQPTNKH